VNLSFSDSKKFSLAKFFFQALGFFTIVLSYLIFGDLDNDIAKLLVGLGSTFYLLVVENYVTRIVLRQRKVKEYKS